MFGGSRAASISETMKTNRPKEVTTLAVLFALGALSQVVFTATNPGYLPIGLLFFAVASYLAVGFIRGWNHARLASVVFLIFMLGLAFLNLAAILFLPESSTLVPEATRLSLIAKNLARVLLLPLVLLYLFRPAVTAYFRRSRSPSPPQQVPDNDLG
jgi:hypothetical protein